MHTPLPLDFRSTLSGVLSFHSLSYLDVSGPPEGLDGDVAASEQHLSAHGVLLGQRAVDPVQCAPLLLRQSLPQQTLWEVLRRHLRFSFTRLWTERDRNSWNNTFGARYSTQYSEAAFQINDKTDSRCYRWSLQHSLTFAMMRSKICLTVMCPGGVFKPYAFKMAAKFAGTL